MLGDKAIGIDLLQQFLASNYGQNNNDMSSLLQQMNQNDQANNLRLMHHFGTQGKPMRHTGINGSIIDPLTGQQVTSGLDQFYNNNPHLRRGESSAAANRRRAVGYSRQDELERLRQRGEADKLNADQDLLARFLARQS